jgi:hypothetical protein
MVSKNLPAVEPTDWTQVTSLSQAMEILGNVVDATDAFGDGVEFVKDKAKLVGQPFLIVDWKFITDETTQREYVNVHAMASNGNQFRFNDGSTGIYKQLKEFPEKVGIKCTQGLRESKYTVPGPNGKAIPAVTYYISN